MSESTSSLIQEREALDRGLGGGLVVSIFAHGLLAAVALTMPFWSPPEPQIRVMDGFSVPLPPGGRGTPDPAPARPQPPVTTPPKVEPEPEEAAPVPPPRVIKPPVEEPARPRLPEPEAKTTKKLPSTAPARPATPARDPRADARPTPASTTSGTGTRSMTPGLEIAPPGLGVPTGTDPNGDWYLAAVQRKIWMLWTQQIKVGFVRPIAVSFTILADGSVADVMVTPSGVPQLDFAAQRAVMTAAPFSPLPKNYGTNRYPIQAIFKPTP